MSRALARDERAPLDAYGTPVALALAICKRLRATSQGFPVETVLEPSAGAGPFVRAAREIWPDAHVTAVDVDPATRTLLHAAGAHTVITDEWPLLACKLANEQGPTPGETRLIVGNPPYTHAAQHVEAGLEWLRDGDRLAFLLRLNLLGARARIGFWRSSPLAYVAPVIPRPSFTGGGTDATEYALFVWRKGHRGNALLGKPIVWRAGGRR